LKRRLFPGVPAGEAPGVIEPAERFFPRPGEDCGDLTGEDDFFPVFPDFAGERLFLDFPEFLEEVLDLLLFFSLFDACVPSSSTL